MTLLSSTKGYVNLDTLSIMNFNVKRNVWWQIHSFKSNISFLPTNSFQGLFIRAPKIKNFEQIKCIEMVKSP